MPKLNSALIPNLAYAMIRSYLFSANSNETTDVYVNAGSGGRTILVLFSSHADVGDNTSSGVGYLRCGYNGNNVHYSHIAGTNPTERNITFSVTSGGYLKITSTSGYYSQVRFDFIGAIRTS